MAITQTSSFVGTPVNELFELLVLGAETVDKGLLHVFQDKRNVVHLNRFRTSTDQIRLRVATPTNIDAMAKDERAITPGKAMFYTEFDPLDFGSEDWPFLWSQGSTVRARAAAELERAILSTVGKSVNNSVDKLTWQGDTLSGDAWLAIADGLIKIIAADAATIKTTPAAITPANVISVLEAVVAACPAPVKEMGAPTIICDHATKYSYREAARALDFKGTNIDGRIQDQFGGYPIASVGGMPASSIVMTNAGGTTSNLKASTWFLNDYRNILIDRLQANSDLFFVKVSFDMGFNYVNGEEIVYHAPA